jgi:hypothetical protein
MDNPHRVAVVQAAAVLFNFVRTLTNPAGPFRLCVNDRPMRPVSWAEPTPGNGERAERGQTRSDVTEVPDGETP